MVGSSTWPWETGGLDLAPGTRVKAFLPPSQGAIPLFTFGTVAASERDQYGWKFKLIVMVDSVRSSLYTNVRPQEIRPLQLGHYLNFQQSMLGFTSEAKLLPSTHNQPGSKRPSDVELESVSGLLSFMSPPASPPRKSARVQQHHRAAEAPAAATGAATAAATGFLQQQQQQQQQQVQQVRGLGFRVLGFRVLV